MRGGWAIAFAFGPAQDPCLGDGALRLTHYT